MRIAVISDTHDKLPDEVCEVIADADEIWHLGDICSPSLLERLKSLGAPVRFVRGNCDSEMEWPLTRDFKLAGIHFHLEHIPTTQPPACDVFLHGHTHVARNEVIGGVQFLNPGCISRPKSAPRSYAWLTIELGRPLEWEVVHF